MDANWFNKTRGPLKDNDPRAKPGYGQARMPDDPARNESRVGGPGRRQSIMRPAQNQSIIVPGMNSRNDYVPRPQTLYHGNTTQASIWNPQQPEILFSNHTRKLRKDQFERGMIINAPVLNEDSNPGISAGSINASISAFCNVYGKPRYLIVAHLFATHYQVMPIFTHGDTGLKGKEAHSHEYITAPLVMDGKGTTTFNKLSVLHLVYPVSRKYDLKISVHGKLLPESAARLVTYIDKASKKGLGL